MPAMMRQYLDQIQQRLKRMESKQKRLIGYGSALLVVTLALLAVVWAYEPYGVLFRDLESAEAGQMVKKLQDAGIPYRLTEQGRTIEVPEAKVAETRLMLASAGVGGKIPAGWELLDNVPMGASEYTVRKRHQRALAGELARTISSMENVRNARVHLSLPQRSLFADRDQKPSASIVIKLVAGHQLNKHEVRSIQSLASHAVEGLQEDAVSVIDSAGELLSADDQNPASSGVSAETQNKHLQQRIVSMLEPVVGQGRVVARVSVDFDDATVVETSKTFFPKKTAIRSEEHQEQEKTGPSLSPSMVGAQGNKPGQKAVAKVAANDSSNRDLTNYEVSYQTRRTERGKGKIQRISAAVLVSPPPPPLVTSGETNNKDLAQKNAEPARISDEKLEEIRQIVMTAIGFNAKRGDQIHVTAMPFIPEENAAPMASVWIPTLLPAIKMLLLALVVVLALLLVVRPMINNLRQDKSIATNDETEETEAAHLAEQEAMQLSAEAEQGSLPPPSETSAEQRARALQAAMDQPERAAEIVRAWLSADRHAQDEQDSEVAEQSQEQDEEIAA